MIPNPTPKKRPEDWLVTADPEKTHGRFKVFLGYAPGVGKTFSMLSEGIRRRQRGEEVLIGIVETHGRKGTAELAAKLEHIPTRQIDYKGTLFSEMDVDPILERHPQVVLIDELAHTNIAGSRNGKRFEDVLVLLDANIDPYTQTGIVATIKLSGHWLVQGEFSGSNDVAPWTRDVKPTGTVCINFAIVEGVGAGIEGVPAFPPRVISAPKRPSL